MISPTSFKKRFLFLALTIAISLWATFFKYETSALFATGHWQLDFLRYQDAARHQEWKEVIQKENDPITAELFADKDKLIKDLYYVYSFNNLPPYVLYKIFSLNGESLWIAQKILMSLLGVLSVLMIFLIASFFYGPLVGFLAGVFLAFSPHFWIAFNLDGAVTRSYNFFFSLLASGLFLYSIHKKNKVFQILAGAAIGINFLFFHIGSFMTPAALFIYGAYLHFTTPKNNRSFYFLKSIALVFLSACLFSSAIQILHCLYFKISAATPMDWFRGYFAKGAEASHTISGIVFFSFKKLLQNIAEHIMGVFVNGRTSADWHYILSPPGVPYVYNFLMIPFFLLGLLAALCRRKRKDAFFLIWLLVFFFVYSFVIVVRQKNIFWETPPIYILSARAIVLSGIFLRRFLHRFSRRNIIYILTSLMLISTIQKGTYVRLQELPRKNFYAGGYLGVYQLYQYIKKTAPSPRTTVVFTLPRQTLVNHMLLRFLLAGSSIKIRSLSLEGVKEPPQEDEWKKFEEAQKADTDTIFYCFLYYDDTMGFIYYSDEFYREVFTKLHPEISPHVITGLDKKPLWRIYQARPNMTTQHSAEKVKQDEVQDAPAPAPAPSVKDIAAPPPQPDDFSTKAIGSTFKLLAKSFVAVVNIAELKKYNIRRLNKMSDDKFKSRYEKVYIVLKDLPDDIKTKFGVTEHMTREQAIQNTASLDKKAIYELLDNIPNHFIADKFRQYLREGKEEIQNSNIVVQIKNFWKKAEAGAKIQKNNE